MSSASSARSARRSEGSAIIPIGPSSRAWSQASWLAPGRRTRSATARAIAGPGATAQAPPAIDDQVGCGQAADLGRGRHQPLEGSPAGRIADDGSGAMGLAPGRQPELAQPIPHPVAIERDRGPGEDPVDQAVLGLAGRDEGSLGDDRRRRLEAVRPGQHPDPGVQADLDQLDPAIEDRGQVGHRPDQAMAAVAGSRMDRIEQLAQAGSGRLPGRAAGP